MRYTLNMKEFNMRIRMIRLIIGGLAVFGVLCVSAYVRAETQYFHHLSDVPVMPALTISPEESYLFDKAQGRIISEVAYADNVSIKSIENYYIQSLPALGWSQEATRFFKRGREKLEIMIETQGSVHRVQFFLSPVSK